jgi:hypothetical protein
VTSCPTWHLAELQWGHYVVNENITVSLSVSVPQICGSFVGARACRLFSDAFSIWDYIASDYRVKSIIFCDVTPCSLLSCNRRFGGTYRLHLEGWRNNFSKNQRAECLPPAYLLVLAEIISSTLKVEAVWSSEMLVATQQTTRCHIPEDDTLHNHRCENLTSYTVYRVIDELEGMRKEVIML